MIADSEMSGKLSSVGETSITAFSLHGSLGRRDVGRFPEAPTAR
jgi:hypothetical protein